MQFTCAPARPPLSAPRQRAPAGATDCHFHIFGPYDRFPLDAKRPYTPPPARLEAYDAMARSLGLTRRVVVQASVSGTDNAVTLDAAARLGAARAICVAAPGADDAALARAGCVGLRFNIVSGNGAPTEALEETARRAAEYGWHLQFFATPEALEALMPRLLALPLPIVLDHMGGARAREPRSWEPALRLLGSGRAWVKLSGTRAGAPLAEVGPLARRLLAEAPERCIWGTDWPHTQRSRAEDVPEDAALLDALDDWLPDPTRRHAVLVDNPARLYGFDDQEGGET
jgi:predicted TIM-barrel fold metal-dependent hydrolase